MEDIGSKMLIVMYMGLMGVFMFIILRTVEDPITIHLLLLAVAVFEAICLIVSDLMVGSDQPMMQEPSFSQIKAILSVFYFTVAQPVVQLGASFFGLMAAVCLLYKAHRKSWLGYRVQESEVTSEEDEQEQVVQSNSTETSVRDSGSSDLQTARKAAGDHSDQQTLDRLQAARAALEQCIQEEETVESDGTLWAGLPMGFFSDMVASLEPHDVMRMRGVCKEWCRMCSLALSQLTPVALDVPLLVATFPNLQCLDLSRCLKGVSGSAIKAAAIGLSQLSSLQLGSVEENAPARLSDRWLGKLASSHCTRLNTLGLATGVHISDQGLIALSRMTSLTSIDLSGCVSVADVGIMLLTQLPHLAALNLSWCLKISHCSLKALNSRSGTLTSLNISGCPLLTEVGLQGLGALTNLQALSASHLGLAWPAVTDRALLSWSALTQLTSLSVGGMQAGLSEVTDAALEGLALHHPNLASLHLMAFDRITDNGLLQLVLQLRSSLTSLYVRSCTGITSAVLPGLAALPKLTDLDMLNCSHTALNAQLVRQFMHPELHANKKEGSSSWATHHTSLLASMNRPPVSEVSQHTALQQQQGDDQLHLQWLPDNRHQGMLAAQEPAAAPDDASTSTAVVATGSAVGVGSAAGQTALPMLLDCAAALAPLKAPQLKSLVLGEWVQPPQRSQCNGLDDACLAESSALGQSLTTLTLAPFNGTITTPAAINSLKGFTALNSLELHACSKLNDEGLSNLATMPCCTSLRTVSFSKLGSLPAASPGLLAFLSKCNHLRQLSLRSLGTAVTDRIMSSICNNMPCLTALHISNAPCITDAGTVKLLQLKRLRELELSCCGRVTGAGFGGMPITAKQAAGSSTSQLLFRALRPPQHQRLHALNLSCSAVDEHGLKVIITHAPHITSLDLSQCAAIKDEAVGLLPALAGMTNLDLSQCSRISDSSLGQLARLSCLTTLRLSGCVHVTDAGIAVLAAAAETWRGLLLTLHLDKCIRLTDVGVQHIAGVTSLTSLRLARCPEITDAGVESLANLTRLSTLSLSHCPRITEAGLVAIASLTTLASLEF